jgi:hypothetical protein
VGVVALIDGLVYCVPNPALQGQALIGPPFLEISVPVLDQLTVTALEDVGLKILVPNPELQGYTKIGVPAPVPVAKYVPSGLKSTVFFITPSSVGLAYFEPNPELLTA